MHPRHPLSHAAAQGLMHRARFDQPLGLATLAKTGYCAAGEFFRDTFRAAHFAPSPLRVRQKLATPRILGRSI
ncbi:hypothetical protein A33M_0319 [Rhodovulum sp. PH10]|uniref:hypothetical protein n=1 Tax=Rhodovulum sp. PH10 TaxID=1187851 RepID=UPI00027C216F|nr:hypothetical protein [Rhodovulum sp. PH10]EJW13160.1 hypothetical protein A33M_0319 [Rhodovulum sp. PH10]